MNPVANKTWLRPLLLATILSIGALLLWTIAVNWVWSVAGQFLSPHESSEQLVFTDDGQPLVQSTSYLPHNTTVYRTLDGQTIDNLDNYELQGGSGWLAGPSMPSFRDPGWQSRVIGFAEPGGAPNYWYLVIDVPADRRAFFVGFDAKTNRGIGYIGRNGFRTDPPPADDCFEIEPNLVSYWGLFAGPPANQGQEPNGYWRLPNRAIFLDSDQELFRVEMRHRNVAAVPLDGETISVANLGQPTRVPEEKHVIEKERIAARLSDRVLVLDNDGQTLRSIPLPPETRDRIINVYLTTGPEAIIMALADLHHELTEVYWLNSAGETARHEHVRLRGGFFVSYEQPAWQTALGSLSPLMCAFDFAILRPRQTVMAGKYHDYRTALAASLADNWAAFAVLVLVSAGLAAFAYAYQLRYSRGGALGWAAFVLLLGAPGLIGYLVHRRWPAVERCRECGARVPRDREGCLVCAASFPPPAPLAIEIFA